MSICKVIFLLVISLTLIGCGATRSVVLEGADKGTFYDPPKDKSLATLYLVCGKTLVDGEYLPEPNNGCFTWYSINGENYSIIYPDEVGRVDIPAGKFTVNNSLTYLDKTGLDPTKTLVAKEGEKMLLVTDININRQPGESFGLVGMGVVAVANSMSSPVKHVHNPLIIYKNDFMNKIIAKKPVKIVVRTD